MMSAIINGSEFWALNKMDEIKIFGWMYGVTRLDRFRNEYMRKFGYS